MNRGIQLASVAALALLFAGAAAAQLPKPSDDEIRRAIKDLGDERFAVRQRALKLLWNARDAAEPHLREAANNSDPEVARQARVLLERIAYRIDPDTPSEVVDLMQRFRNASGIPAEQSQIIRDLLRLGTKGQKYLLRLLDAVDDKQRRLILDEFAYDDWKVLSVLMAEGQEPLVEQLLNKALAASNDTIVPHYAAYQALAGRLDARIAEFRGKVEKSSQAFDASVLLALCRLNGDSEGALWAARRAQNPKWVRQLLMERGRWQELLAEHAPAPRSGLAGAADLGHRAAYQRLAGRDADFHATVKQIEAWTDEPAGPRANRVWYAAKVLLVNGRPAEALSLLRKYEQHTILAEILADIGRYREALDVSARAAEAESGSKYPQRAVHIDLLLRTGQHDKAREWLTKLARDMGDSTDPGWLDRLASFQIRLGDRAGVEKRLLARLERQDGSALGAAFAALYPRLGGQAEALLTMLRRLHPDVDSAALLLKLRQIDEGTMPAADLAEVLRREVPVNRNTNQANFETVARLVAALGIPDVATALLAHPNWERAPPESKLYLADTLADAGNWLAAAEAYRKIWEQNEGAALPLFLHAKALLRIKAADARALELVERSHRMPLGSDSVRHDLAAALRARGFDADSFRELEFCSRLVTGNTYVLGNAQDSLARRLAARGDFTSAATIHERNILRVMAPSSGFIHAGAYVRVPAEIHVLRARALLAEGRRDAGVREIERAEALHPANLDLVIRLTPALRKAGEGERAEQLYTRVATHWRKACDDFPACAEAHNSIAWLCARCRRDLDDGLFHARSAVRLAPLNPSFHDTLAELLFQKGERRAALELIRKCTRMPGANTAFLRRQLSRFESGRPEDDPVED